MKGRAILLTGAIVLAQYVAPLDTGGYMIYRGGDRAPEYLYPLQPEYREVPSVDPTWILPHEDANPWREYNQRHHEGREQQDEDGGGED